MLPALLLALSACTRAPEPLTVLIVVDTLRFDALSFAGAPLDSASPNIDALRQESVWMSRAYSSSSWTLPSTATLFTGLHPWQHRVVRQAGHECFGRLREDIPTIASVAKQRDQRTAAFINNAFLAPEFNLNLSFDVYDFHGAQPMGHRTAKETVELALAWVDQDPRGGLLVVHIMEPHTFYDPGPTWQGTYTQGMPHDMTVPIPIGAYEQWISGQVTPSPNDKLWIRAAYQEEVRATDEAVGILIDGLKQRGRWAQSTVVFTADHGEEFWERGRYEHGHTLLDEVTRVPLLIKAPGLAPGENQTVVDGTVVFPLLVSPESAAWRVVRGPSDPSRAALSQGILYGLQQVSIISPTHRLVVALEPDEAGRRFGGLYAVQDGVSSLEPLAAEHPDQAQVGPSMGDTIKTMRGSFDPTVPTNPGGIHSADVFEQLRAQGYLEFSGCE